MSIHLYISTIGKTNANGTINSPFNSLERALDHIKNHSQFQDEEIIIMIQPGIYRFYKTLSIESKDFKYPYKSIKIEASKKNSVVFDGSLELSLKWSKYKNNIFQAELPREKIKYLLPIDSISDEFYIDQLFINGKLQQMARSPNFPGNYEIKGKGASNACLNRKLIKKWNNPKNGIINAIAHHKWGSVHYKILKKNLFSKLKLSGGKQINRSARLHSKLRYVENIFEELDYPGEWYYNTEKEILYYYPPDDVDLTSAKVEIVFNRELIRLVGTEKNPLIAISFIGITFSKTRRVILDNFEPLLRGDWCIVRKAAIFLTGTEKCSITQCNFENCGGNAVFLNDYNRDTVISQNEFKNIGESAIVIVGNIDAVRSPSIEYHNSLSLEQIDRVPGPKSNNFPKNCIISNNLIYQTGIWGKQTAGVLISMAEDINVEQNTIFALPRAGICINDGTWGGHIIKNNWVFDTVRETGDHGPFNSWGRDRHWQTKHAGFVKGDQSRALKDSRLDTHHPVIIDHNRFEHYISHSWGIDMDDGTSNYIVKNNLCLGCSIKLREGFYRIVENNICIGPQPLAKHASYNDNHDIVRHNIYINTKNDSIWEGIQAKFKESEEIDNNLFFNHTAVDNELLIKLKLAIGESFSKNGNENPSSLTQMQKFGIEHNSLWSDPLFEDTFTYNFQVKQNSPAHKIGFTNFSMNNFGTQIPEFKSYAEGRYSQYIGSLGTQGDDLILPDDNQEWNGAMIKNLNTPGEQSATGMPEIKGIYFNKVPENSLAFRQGFRPNDVLLHLDGAELKNVDEFLLKVDKVKNQKVETGLFRIQKDQSIIIHY
jgi:parallel beta helix pectate lyase-like protein